MIQKLAPSEWIALTSILIDVIAMLVGGLLAIWVVQRIQTKMDAEQKLKDFFSLNYWILGKVIRILCRIYMDID